MAYDEMTAEEVLAFLRADPPRPATVATTRLDGRPHLTPVWFGVDDDGTVVFTTPKTSVKGRTLLRDARLSLCVDDDAPPFAYVIVEGTAELSDDANDVRAWATRIAGRYMGAARAEDLGRAYSMDDWLVRVRVDRVLARRDVVPV